ncbi:MAG: bifunctional riboflavin kinase/FAD synthetase [Nitrospinota bacterium]
MKIYRGTQGIAGRIRRPVVTIGNFDGIHLGHIELFNNIQRKARDIYGETVVFTFRPHPLRILSPKLSPPLLTSFKRKIELIQKAGIDNLICARFTERFASQGPRIFAEQVLVKELNVKEVVVGYDYKFGRGRRGNIQYLQKMGDEFDFEVTVLDPVEINGEVVSSTSIRKSLEVGEVEEAAKRLGRPYSVEGVVTRGRGIGGRAGVHTANITPPPEILPRVGVYAVRVGVGEIEFDGVSNVGFSPTFHRDSLMLETHILGFDQDIYGQKIEIKFIHRLRDEIEFGETEALFKRVKKDIAEATFMLKIDRERRIL